LFFRDRRETLTQELEKVKAEKRALENLSKSGRISSEVYRDFDEDLSETLKLIEERLENLEKEISRRKEDLEQQILILEKSLAGLESEYAIGLVEEEDYRSKYKCLMMGLEASKREIEGLSGAPTASPQEAEPVKEEAVTELAPSEETLEVVEEEEAQPLESEVQESSGLVSLEEVEDEVAVLGMELVKDQMMDEWNGGNDGSEIHCMNPWNRDCRNTDIEVYIYYNNERIPICRLCWEKLADKELDW